MQRPVQCSLCWTSRAAGTSVMRVCTCRPPQFGDVVEYPLRDIEVQELQDGRTAGVGPL